MTLLDVPFFDTCGSLSQKFEGLEFQMRRNVSFECDQQSYFLGLDYSCFLKFQAVWPCRKSEGTRIMCFFPEQSLQHSVQGKQLS